MDFLPIIAAGTGFLTAYLFGYPLIPFLKKLKFGQTIREDGPKWHASKEGTPTMGGILIILGMFVAIAVAALLAPVLGSSLFKAAGQKTVGWIAAAGLALGMGFIGFIDDYIKVVKKRNLGLTARQKTFLQLLVSAAFLSTLGLSGMNTTWLPFLGEVSITEGVGVIFWPIALFFVYGFTNAVNLTDGIDGLAGSVTIIVSCTFLLIGGILGFSGANIMGAALAGSLIGFIIWNAHPAKVFMGDTGSLFLGGAVVGLSFAVGRPVVLLLAGIVYLIEALSVIIQVAHYKRTKKRIFKMAPLHHHFEMSGWSEERIVFVLSFVTFIACFVCLVPILFF